MIPYVSILMTAVIAGLMIAGAYGFSAGLNRGVRPCRVAPFLGGAAPCQHAMSRFHVRWYAVALLFLAFDMEMVFMYPWAVVVADIGMMALIEMGMFLLILLLGVLYAWREGALRWT